MKYSREQILELYKTLPEDLKHALDSDKAINTLEDLSVKHKLSNEQAEIFIDAVNEVILGILPPNEFQQKLETAKISKQIAKNINTVVTRFIFYPVKDSLNALYDISLQQQGEAKSVPKKNDSYREEIE